MAGFFVTNIKATQEVELTSYKSKKLFRDEITNNEYVIKRESLNSFKNDKLMYETKNKIVITEGIVCNSKDLFEKNSVDNFQSLIENMFENDEVFFKEFRGSFSGGIYSKSQNKWIFYTDQLGSHSLYYYYDKNNNEFVVASQLIYITDFLKAQGKSVQVDEHGLHCMLDWGYIIDNASIVKDIKRLYPGEYLVFEKSQMHIYSYYVANYSPKNLTMAEYINNLDYAFGVAVKRIIEKCEQNDYKALLDISGGLDSRMIAFKANEVCNNESITAFTFSQNNSIEQKVAFEVAQKLNIEIFYKMLDTDKFLTNMKDVMLLNNGSSYYLGLQAGLSLGEFVDSRVYGVEITGLMGDMRDSSMLLKDGKIAPVLDGSIFKSNTLNPLNQYSNYSAVMDYFDTNEVFWLYLRGIMAGMNTAVAKQNFIEVMTPFGDVDFLEAYLSIPWEERVEKKVLLEWMKLKYPEAMEIKYAAINLPAKYTWTWVHKHYERLRRRVIRHFHKEKGMLDLQKWMNNNKTKSCMDDFYKEAFNNLNIDDEIRHKIELLYTKGNPLEKSIALSVLSAYNLYIAN